ncbi:histidine kinase [Thermodesulfovibrio hydrogeniphilus]
MKKRIDFQIKVIIATTFVLIVVLFYLNTMTFTFLDDMLRDLSNQFTLKGEINKKIEFEKRYAEYLKDILLWESLLALSLMLILYKIIQVLTKKEIEYQKFLELLIMLISHKFGNFLAIHRTNIDILKKRYDIKALDRLEKSYEYIQEDLSKILNTLISFKSPEEKETIFIKEIVEKIVFSFPQEKKIILKLNNTKIRTCKMKIENIIFFLFENSIKYSKSFIHIRLTSKYLAIRNDINYTKRGSGIGLKIVDWLANKEKIKLRYRCTSEIFFVILKFK